MSVVEFDRSEAAREMSAKRIKALMQDWTTNTLAIGAELTAAHKTFPPPKREQGRGGREPRFASGFVKWAKQATGLSDRQVEQLVLIHEKFGGANRQTLEHLPQRVMKLLVQADVPESARREVLDRAHKGEHIGTTDAKKIVQIHKLPSAKEANAQAKDEGRPVLARDGYIYFGTDPNKAKEGEDRRTMVYGVRRALDTLGSIHLTSRQFLDYALPHQLWTKDEASIIKRALRWLTALDEAWDTRE